MNKWPSRIQGHFYFTELGGARKEHGFHSGSEGGVPLRIYVTSIDQGKATGCGVG